MVKSASRGKPARSSGIHCVAYLRMSSDKQDKSLPAQRQEIQRWCDKHDYSVIQWYEEPGISGDDTRRRIVFQRMMSEVIDSDATAIVVWDQDRFGRFDSVESGFWIHPLRAAGISLATVTEGVKDWHSYAGRVVYGVMQEGKHQFLQDLAKNVSRGHLANAEKGLWVSGIPPIGYLVGDDKKLVLASPEEVAIVRQVFDLCERGYSIRGIATELSLHGKHPQTGCAWGRQTVSRILNRPFYAGYYIYPQLCNSKYASASLGGTERKGYTNFAGEDDLEEARVFLKDNHPAIITKEQFWNVQAKLRCNKANTTPHTNGGSFLFSGLLFCGRCGGKLSGANGDNGVYYDCNHSQRTGNCERNRVHQDDMLERIGKTLSEWASDPSTIEALELTIASLIDNADKNTSSEAVLGAKLDAIQAKLRKAKIALVEVDKDMREIVQEQIRELNRENAELESEIAARQALAHSPKLTRSKLESALTVASRLPDALKSARTPEARSLIATLVSRIDVKTEKRGNRWEIADGTAHIFNPLFSEQKLSRLS